MYFELTMLTKKVNDVDAATRFEYVRISHRELKRIPCLVVSQLVNVS